MSTSKIYFKYKYPMYRSHFEKSYLDSTSQFYRQQSQKRMAQKMEIEKYLNVVNENILFEFDRANLLEIQSEEA